MIPSWSNRWQTFDFGEVYSVINCVRYLCRIDCYTLLHWKAITNPAKAVYYPSLTWLGFEATIYCRRGEYANHYTTYEVSLMRQLIPNNPEHKVSFWFFLWSSLLAKLVSFCFAFFYPFAILFLYPVRTFNVNISSDWRTMCPSFLKFMWWLFMWTCNRELKATEFHIIYVTY